MIFGPQNEPIFEERDLTKVPNSSVASGTDRDIVNTEQTVLVGPQGEKLYSPDGICPLCGQQFPEACSQPGADLSAQPGATPDPEAIREDDYIDEIDEPEDDEAFDGGASPNEFELLA